MATKVGDCSIQSSIKIVKTIQNISSTKVVTDMQDNLVGQLFEKRDRRVHLEAYGLY